MVICQICEHENETDQRFCDECGAELQPSEQTGAPKANNAPTLDETSELATADGTPLKIHRLLSLGRLNRYSCTYQDGPALLLEETPTAPGVLAHRDTLLAPLKELASIWQPGEAFEHNERTFAVSALPSGPTLDERVCSEGALTAAELRELAVALAELLQDLHRKQFLLRSLQPDRIWWNPESKALVVDSFERLVPLESSDGDFQVINGFSPPEAYGVGDAEVGVTSDLYTAGAILHFAGSGQRTDLESRENFFSFPPISELDDEVLAACIARLTSKNAAQRLTDAQDFREFLDSETVPPVAAPVPQPASKPEVAASRSSAPDSSVSTDSPNTGAEQACSYTVALQSHVGCVRTINQDACLQLKYTSVEKSQAKETHLVVVIDGMGGEAEGDKAASIALRTIAKEVLEANLSLNDERSTAPLLPGTTRERNMLVLERALKRANRNIFEYAERDHKRQGMGCTITACILEPDEVTIGHIGDTRAYHLRGEELSQLTKDHSLVGTLVEMGRLTVEEARNSPQRSLLCRAVGTTPDVEVDVYHKELQAGDRLMVSSDGVWEYFSATEMQQLMEVDQSAAEIANNLVEICLQRGADDNATLAVIFAH